MNCLYTCVTMVTDCPDGCKECKDKDSCDMCEYGKHFDGTKCVGEYFKLLFLML